MFIKIIYHKKRQNAYDYENIIYESSVLHYICHNTDDGSDPVVILVMIMME